MSKCDDIEYSVFKKVQGVEGVVKLYGFFQLQTEDVFVMEKPEGCRELNDHNDNFWKCNPGKKLIFYESYGHPLFKKAVKTLYGCHKKKVFHGDIHLGNFLIDKYGKVFLIDFGLGKTVKKEGFLSSEYKGGFLMFDDYKPPEAYLTDTTTCQPEKVTVWCLGIDLYRMMNGNYKYPFTTIEEVLSGELSVNPEYSPKCQEILRKCLEKDPNKRITLAKLVVLANSWMPVFKSSITASPDFESAPKFAPKSSRVIDRTGDSTNKSATRTATVITRKRNHQYDQIVTLKVKAKKPKVQIQQEEQSHQQQSHHLPQQQVVQPQQPLQQQPMLIMQPTLEMLQLQIMQQHMMQQMMQQLPQQQLVPHQQPLQQQPMQVMQQQLQNFGIIAFPHQAQQTPQPGLDSGYQNKYTLPMNNFHNRPNS